MRMNLSKTSSWILIATGVFSLVISTIYSSQIPAFIGLGLLFWGIILAYVRTEEHIKTNLLTATASQPLKTLEQIIQQLDYKGTAVYLPPKYVKDPEEIKAYIPKQKQGNLPNPEQTQRQESLFTENPNGILLTPPGAELTRLFEKTLGTTFTRVNLQYFEQNMPKLLIEDLEIAQDIEIQTEGNKILARIKTTTYSDLCKTTLEAPETYGTFGCPLTSAIASALAKTTGRLVTIHKEQTSPDTRSIEIEYRLTG